MQGENISSVFIAQVIGKSLRVDCQKGFGRLITPGGARCGMYVVREGNMTQPQFSDSEHIFLVSVYKFYLLDVGSDRFRCTGRILNSHTIIATFTNINQGSPHSQSQLYYSITFQTALLCPASVKFNFVYLFL